MKIPNAILFVAVALSSGCVSFHGHQPMVVRVLDRETDEPVPSATVAITYRAYKLPVLNRPQDDTDTTDPGGVVRLRLATGYKYGSEHWSVSAEGYLPHAGTFVSNEEYERWTPRPMGLSRDDFLITDEDSNSVYLYREPLPSIRLQLPVGYRGVVRVVLDVSDPAPAPNGTRSFEVVVPPSGFVQLPCSRLLARDAWGLWSRDLTAAYADGSPLETVPFLFRPRHSDDDIMLRALHTHARQKLWVLGTYADAERVWRSFHVFNDDSCMFDVDAYRELFTTDDGT